MTEKGLLVTKGKWEAAAAVGALPIPIYPLYLLNVPGNKVSSGVASAQSSKLALSGDMYSCRHLTWRSFNSSQSNSKFVGAGSPGNCSLGPNGWLDGKGNAIHLAVVPRAARRPSLCELHPRTVPNWPSHRREDRAIEYDPETGRAAGMI